MLHGRRFIAKVKAVIDVLDEPDSGFQLLFVDLFLAATGAGKVAVNDLVV